MFEFYGGLVVSGSWLTGLLMLGSQRFVPMLGDPAKNAQRQQGLPAAESDIW